MAVKIDSSIVDSYLENGSICSYKDLWIYNSFEQGSVFEKPDPINKIWVYKLRDKLINQIKNFFPYNYNLIKRLFPHFDEVVANYTVMLVVGFQYPYDAMILEHNGKQYMILDLIQFGEGCLEEGYSCNGILTHELTHICLHNKYSYPSSMSYIDELNYKTFDEGFAHALSYIENNKNFNFNEFLENKFCRAKEKFKEAISETEITKQRQFIIAADTGDYWDKFASICGKLYLLKNLNEIELIYKKGWCDFANTVIN